MKVTFNTNAQMSVVLDYLKDLDVYDLRIVQSKEVTLRLSKDQKAVIIGGKRYPLTVNNLEAWQQYKLDGDKKRLKFKLSKVVLSYE